MQSLLVGWNDILNVFNSLLYLDLHEDMGVIVIINIVVYKKHAIRLCVIK